MNKFYENEREGHNDAVQAVWSKFGYRGFWMIEYVYATTIAVVDDFGTLVDRKTARAA